MKIGKPRAEMNPLILGEAAEWLVELNSGDADLEARRRFDAWLRSSPEHIRAYLELVPIWQESGSCLEGGAAAANSLIALARKELNVVPMDAGAGPQGQSGRGRSARPDRPAGWAIAAAASLVLAILGSAAAWYEMARYPMYRTEVGEQRSILLADGSVLELNSLTKVRVEYTPTERDIELVTGQALFEVAKSPGRPFVVFSGPTRVLAVGTQFDVYHDPSRTTVTVLEGKVAVLEAGQDSRSLKSEAAAAIAQSEGRRPAHSPGSSAVAGSARDTGTVPVSGPTPLLLSAGQQATVSAGMVSSPRRVDAALATAWLERRLVFDSTPLPDAVREFNRYNSRKLIIGDPKLERFLVSGVFSSTSPASLLRFLRAQTDLRVQDEGTDVLITSR